ncbi:RNA-binding protein 28-like [Diachasmimorpha longicaudata]|uniref:RNA-binding protein 28-like n=1 Tax=Diachasmimorpha longicaudata TaxID=58733 RepID=UPI0030B8E71E
MMKTFNRPRQDTKKLSWVYRNKKRQKRTQARTNNEGNTQVQNNKARIIVRNLSFEVTEDDVRKLYEPFGQIEQIDLLRRPDGKPVGCGFIQFKRIEDASRAIFKTNKTEFLSRPITVTWAIPKDKFIENQNTNIAVKPDGKSSPAKEDPDVGVEKIKKESTAELKKQCKLRKQQKRSRIIVRNLPFAVTEEDLKNYFSEYGNITEVKLLTKSDGKRVGCGFLQFDHVQSAAKAIRGSNLRPLMDRLIVVDWAVPKDQFQNANKNEVQEKDDKDVALIDENNDIKLEDEPLNEEDDDEEDEAEESEEENKIELEKSLGDEDDKGPRRISNDVSEGKTVFLKNVPFSVNNDQLKSCMEQFGPVYYALVCIDPLTEHSKGTAFVKFRNLEDAEKCLASGTELQIQGETLDPHRAITKKDVLDSKSRASNRTKDSRNLYLVKEGVILPGSHAAADVSPGDMQKRIQMEQWKSQMLRNLNMFVSRIRLVVHNLPATLDDVKLREIFRKHAGKNAVITEAKVMRDLKNPDPNSVGRSKEFGFVAFTNHDDALRALRSINNNPNIFSKGKRPIVAFSIENRIMVNAKQRRAQKSRNNNPLWKGKRSGDSSQETTDGPPLKRSKKIDKTNNKNNSKSERPGKAVVRPVEDENVSGFSGTISRVGDRKLRSKFNLKTQARLQAKAQNNQKKERKMKRKIEAQKVIERNSRKEIKPKQGPAKFSKEEANLDRMVENYRSKLSKISSDKIKWYET